MTPEQETPEPRPTLVVQVRYKDKDLTVREVELPDEHQWKELITLTDLSIYHPDARLIFFVREP